jgi:hypothetical protein
MTNLEIKLAQPPEEQKLPYVFTSLLVIKEKIDIGSGGSVLGKYILLSASLPQLTYIARHFLSGT